MKKYIGDSVIITRITNLKHQTWVWYKILDGDDPPQWYGAYLADVEKHKHTHTHVYTHIIAHKPEELAISWQDSSNPDHHLDRGHVARV
jgi:hypothetical protein